MSAPVTIGSTPLFQLTFQEEDENGALVAVDLSAATVLRAHFRRPDGTTFSQDLTLSGTGTDGKAEYQSDSEDLDQAGPWQIEGWAEWADGKRFGTEPGEFLVIHPLLAE